MYNYRQSHLRLVIIVPVMWRASIVPECVPLHSSLKVEAFCGVACWLRCQPVEASKLPFEFPGTQSLDLHATVGYIV